MNSTVINESLRWWTCCIEKKRTKITDQKNDPECYKERHKDENFRREIKNCGR